jgi:hypothetical protein
LCLLTFPLTGSVNLHLLHLYTLGTGRVTGLIAATGSDTDEASDVAADIDAALTNCCTACAVASAPGVEKDDEDELEVCVRGVNKDDTAAAAAEETAAAAAATAAAAILDTSDCSPGALGAAAAVRRFFAVEAALAEAAGGGASATSVEERPRFGGIAERIKGRDKSGWPGTSITYNKIKIKYRYTKNGTFINSWKKKGIKRKHIDVKV